MASIIERVSRTQTFDIQLKCGHFSRVEFKGKGLEDASLLNAFANFRPGNPFACSTCVTPPRELDMGRAARDYADQMRMATGRVPIYAVIPKELSAEELAVIHPVMRKFVTWLNLNGFHTTDSGDGVSNAGMECALDHPNVFIMLKDPEVLFDEVKRLTALCRHELKLKFQNNTDGPRIEGSYSPNDEGSGAIIAIYNVTDNHLPTGIEGLWTRKPELPR